MPGSSSPSTARRATPSRASTACAVSPPDKIRRAGRSAAIHRTASSASRAAHPRAAGPSTATRGPGNGRCSSQFSPQQTRTQLIGSADLHNPGNTGRPHGGNLPP